MLSALLVALTLSSAQLTSDLQWRAIGPAITGGRVDDIAVDESHPDTIYIGAATGGVWKTVNGGATWKPIFDQFGTTSIGDIAVSRSNPNVVWVGTGEANNRQSSSWGNGVYKSTDGGATWQHVGLSDTKHIGRIVIHPSNADIVYVAALGHLWGPNRERGLFKTTDGGKTWTNTKFIDEDTGFVDVAMDSRDPNTLYAAAYQRQRKAYGFNGGGPGSGLYKTTDGGKTWTRLEHGLPAGNVGRIGIDISRRNPNVVYVSYEHKDGGIFRSDDRGRTWTKMSGLMPRPLYFSQIRVDPQDDRRIYMLGTQVFVSDDGGRTFRSDGARNVHVDHHAMWIDPANPSVIWLGNDGGVWVSRDRSQTWTRINNIPLAQPYVVAMDTRDPYYVYVGLQDNGVWSGPGATRHRIGPVNDDWIQVGGGDGMYVTVPPNDPTTAYVEMQDGRVMRFDTRTGETKAIRPFEHVRRAEAADQESDPLRFNWTTPIVVSPHNPLTIYVAGDRLWRSLDRGEHWTAISGDLSRHIDRDTLPIMGVKPGPDMLGRNDGITAYGTATAMAESPVRPGLLAVGTDDGLVQMSSDGGASWHDLTASIPNAPDGAWVSGISMSSSDARRLYVAFDNHRNDDYRAYLYRSDDGGTTWRSMTNGLPETAVRTVREDPFDPNLLFAGTEQGLFWSSSAGDAWQRLGNHLPDVPVLDVQVHPRDHDLVIATHGRGVYIMPIEPLELALSALSGASGSAGIQLLAPQTAVTYTPLEHRDFLAQSTYVGGNRPRGALIYYLAGDASPSATLSIKDAGGETLRTIPVAVTPGLHRVAWDLRLEAPPQPTRQKPPDGVLPADPRPAESTLARIPGDFGGGGDPTGGEAGAPPEPLHAPIVKPGTYQLILTAGGSTSTSTLRVQADPRATVSDAALEARWRLLRHVYETQRDVVPKMNRAIEIRDAVDATVKALKDERDASEELKKYADDTATQTRRAQGRLSRLVGQLGSLGRDVEESTSAPTDAQERQLAAFTEDLGLAALDVDKLLSSRIAELNRRLDAASISSRVPRVHVDAAKRPTA